jgi:hypothetical protein
MNSAAGRAEDPIIEASEAVLWLYWQRSCGDEN